MKLGEPTAARLSFAHNVTSGSAPNSIDTDGVLAYNWRANGGNLFVSSAMSMSHGPTTNIGQLTFQPGATPYVLVSFDEDGAMYMSSAIDDTVSPPKVSKDLLKVENCESSLLYDSIETQSDIVQFTRA